MPDDTPTVGLRVVESLAAVDAAQWDACALAPGLPVSGYVAAVAFTCYVGCRLVARLRGRATSRA